MKELYTAPEMETFALVAEEKLAAYELEFDTMLAASNEGEGVSFNENFDIDVVIPRK